MANRFASTTLACDDTGAVLLRCCVRLFGFKEGALAAADFDDDIAFDVEEEAFNDAVDGNGDVVDTPNRNANISSCRRTSSSDPCQNNGVPSLCAGSSNPTLARRWALPFCGFVV